MMLSRTQNSVVRGGQQQPLQHSISRSRSRSLAVASASPATSSPSSQYLTGLSLQKRKTAPPPPANVAAVILGGGESDSRRLFPLTDKRTLPAIPIGGIYRLIDVVMSNCIHSNIFKIYILTQYNSTSLNRYLTRTYDLGGGIPVGGDGFMEVVAATQSPNSQRWADGPADSVRQWMGLLDGTPKTRAIEDILVLPSDQVYRTDFGDLVAFHRESLADITIVCHEVKESKADQFGIVKLDGSSKIIDFAEKPKGDDKVSMSMDWDELDTFLELGSTPLGMATASSMTSHGDGERAYIASCGMYVFRRDVLKKLLNGKKARDFGRELIPEAIKEGYRVMAYHLDSFWEDIGGSIADFYDLNIRLASANPPFVFNSTDSPFFARPMNLSPSQLEGCRIKESIIGSGCFISESEISKSIIGSRSVIGAGCKVTETIVMGSDYYEEEKDFNRAISPSFPHIGIGAGSIVHKCIIDKNARIGINCQLTNKEGIWESFDMMKSGVCIRDGILIVSKSSVVPDGTII